MEIPSEYCLHLPEYRTPYHQISYQVKWSRGFNLAWTIVFAGRLLVQRPDYMCYGRIVANSDLFDFINLFQELLEYILYILYLAKNRHIEKKVPWNLRTRQE